MPSTTFTEIDLMMSPFYFTNTTQKQQDQRLQQQICKPSEILPDEQTQSAHSGTLGANNHSTTQAEDIFNVPNTLGGAFSNIPFVQIHTTDVQPQNSGFGNTFRRNTNNNDIKFEPIKSESADTLKERGNTNTPTLPARSNSSSSSELSTTPSKRQNVENLNNKTLDNSTLNLGIDGIVANAAPPFPNVFKCGQCPFMCLTQVGIDSHQATHSNISEVFCAREEIRLRLSCPGCDNVFYCQNSLDVHLREDHLMTSDESKNLLNAVRSYSCVELTNTNENRMGSAAGVNTTDSSRNDHMRKSRIYLKNVDCLREPCREPIECQENQIHENYFPINSFSSDCKSDATDSESVGGVLTAVCNPKSTSSSNQKIYIKSVDVLREPALLQHDYEPTSESNFLNICNEIDLPNIDGLNADCDYTADGKNNGTNDNDSNISAHLRGTDNLRMPKIFIKNVDILKEPNIFTTQTAGNEYINNGNNLTASYEPNLAQASVLSDQFLFDNFNNNFMPKFANAEAAKNFLLDNESLVNALNFDSSHSSAAPIVTEPTPPPSLPEAGLPNTPKASAQTDQQMQKIFIKNVDILKQPQFQEPRGTLHLRTVDELNLMNKNEVENLITPNLDNTQATFALSEHFGITNNTSESLELVDGSLYSDSYKLQDFGCWSDDVYDLGDDIDCIITDTITPTASMTTDSNKAQLSHKIIHELDTPQMSLISIRDIDELTAMPQPIEQTEHNAVDQSLNGASKERNFEDLRTDCVSINSNFNSSLNARSDVRRDINNISKNGPPTLFNRSTTSATPNNNESIEGHMNMKTISASAKHTDSFSAPSNTINFSDVPPLAPVTNTVTNYAKSSTELPAAIKSPSNGIPPLVSNRPVPPLVMPVRRGRIYVANNLMEHPANDNQHQNETPVVVTVTRGTSVRGRPFGSKTEQAKKQEPVGSTSDEEVGGFKCNYRGCDFRFKKMETLDYHGRCHPASDSSASQAIICPECKLDNFSSWNTLHTHLWRAHKIDMELYSCQLCPFKTPVHSRLMNTHAKIHSEVRDYKCDQCSKAFKNTKQLKNHRRLHRIQSCPGMAETTSNCSEFSPTTTIPPTLHRCSNCSSVFSHQKSLREHVCKDVNQFQCDICDRVVSSKSSLKLHMSSHEESKRFQCTLCSYQTSDHNAFRRHKMVHENAKMYDCPFCEYKSIQSSAFQRHVASKHPDMSQNLVHKCDMCSFSSINRALFLVHQAKHLPFRT